MGVDEAIQIHERWMGVLNILLNYEFKGIFTFSWVIIGIPIAIIASIYFYFFIIKINKKIMYLFIFSASLYLIGSIGFELIAGYIFDKNGFNFLYQILANIEETLEMFGIMLFLKGLLKYIKTETNKEGISFNIEIT